MKRVTMHRLQELVRLHRMGTRVREAARLLQMSPNTERRFREALREAGLWDGPREELPELEVLRGAVGTVLRSQEKPQHESSVVKWREMVAGMLETGAAPTAIYDF
jgi:hypothetical protein